MINYVIGGIVFLLIVLAVKSIIQSKKNGTGSCGCGCNNCHSHCHDQKKC